MGILRKILTTAAVAAGLMAGAAQAEPMRIALVVKALGIGFFEAANKGAEEAAKELGDVEIIYTGPTDTTAEGQIEVINALIAQGVDAIAISANDPDALVPALKKAMERGIARWPPDAPEPVVQCPDRQHDHQAGRRQHARWR
jgi:rhamnose transport system substrate-binding protein